MSKKRITGKIVSAKMDKTVVVSVEMPKKHPLYGKLIKNTRRFKARNEFSAVEGDYVVIEECKLFGKGVSWIVVEKVEALKEKK